MLPEPSSHRRLNTGVEEARSAVRQAVDAWNGTWDESSDQFEISVRAGLRTGRQRGSLSLAGDRVSSHLTIVPLGATFRLIPGAVVLLLIAGASGVPLLLWPFFPRLIPLLPVALVLSVGGWFLVTSRLQNQGLEEFLDTVDLLVGEGSQSAQ